MIATIGKQIEIVGIQTGSHGRTCCYHKSCCGQAIEIGTLLKIRDGSIDVTTQNRVEITNDTVSSTEPKKRGRPCKAIQHYEVRTESVVLDTKIVYLAYNGIESCCIGFVSLAFQNIYYALLDGKMLRVQGLSTESSSSSEERRNKEYSGIALAKFVN